MTYSSQDLPTKMDVLAAVCLLLVRRPRERPVVAEVAALFDDSERLLRTRWRSEDREPLRSLMAFGCSLRAAWLVHADGEKCSSAAREVGHTRTWSLNQPLKKRLGVTLCDCREQLPDGFDWDDLSKTYLEIEARTVEVVDVSA